MATRRGFDDSDEDTAIDLRSSDHIAKALKNLPSDTAQSVRGKPPDDTAAAPGKSTVFDASDDDEATEFLSVRPSSSADGAVVVSTSDGRGSMRASGRAVPLEAGDKAAGADAQKRRSRENSESHPHPAIEAAAPLPQRTPRPLPQRGKSESASALADADPSMPHITRFTPDTALASSPAAPTSETASSPRRVSFGDDKGPAPELPRHRPLPERADGLPRAPIRPAPRPPTIVAHADPSPDAEGDPKARKKAEPEPLEADPADGTLIVEVPEGAIVFLNGVERGVGPTLKVRDLDRYAKHAVRIHAQGFSPWSGTVCLEGRTAAKIRPALKKREK